MFCQHMQGAQSICVIEAHSSNNASPASTLTVSALETSAVMALTGEQQEQKFPVQYFACGICAYWCVFQFCARVPVCTDCSNTQAHMQILPFDGHLSARVHRVQALTAVL